MASPTKVVALGLEDVVLGGREKGLSLEKIRDACNEQLVVRGGGDTISKPSIERYLRTLDKASVAPAHQPQLAGRAAEQAIDFMDRLVGLDEKLQRWVTEADEAEITVMIGHGEASYTERRPDWQARTSVAREISRVLTIYADVAERVHNAQHVAEFQRIIFEAIRDADGPTATKIMERLQQVRAARQAGMLGLE